MKKSTDNLLTTAKMVLICSGLAILLAGCGNASKGDTSLKVKPSNDVKESNLNEPDWMPHPDKSIKITKEKTEPSSFDEMLSGISKPLPVVTPHNVSTVEEINKRKEYLRKTKLSMPEDRFIERERIYKDGQLPAQQAKSSFRFRLSRIIDKLKDNPRHADALFTLENGVLSKKANCFEVFNTAKALAELPNTIPPSVKEKFIDHAIHYGHYFRAGTENHATINQVAGIIWGELYPDLVFKIKTIIPRGEEVSDMKGVLLKEKCKEGLRRYGQAVYSMNMIEVISDNYFTVNLSVLSDLYALTKDQEVKSITLAIMDYMTAVVALNCHFKTLVDPNGRVHRDFGVRNVYPWMSPLRALWLYGRDLPKPTPERDIRRFGEYSTYIPSPAIRHLCVNNFARPFMYLQAQPSLGYLHHMRGATSRPHKLGKVLVEKNLIRSLYVNNEYALGTGNSRRPREFSERMAQGLALNSLFSCSWESKGIPKQSSYNGGKNWVFTIHPYWFTGKIYGDPKDKKNNYKYGISRAPKEYNGQKVGENDLQGTSPFQQSVHWENAAIVFNNIPKTDPYRKARLNHSFGKTPRAKELYQVCFFYFYDVMDEIAQTEDGYFIRNGNVYIAVLPFDMKGTKIEGCPYAGLKRIRMPGSLTGFAFEVGDAAEYGSFKKFQSAVSRKNLDTSKLQSDQQVTYTSSRGHVLKMKHTGILGDSVPEAEVNGVKLDYAKWPALLSPHCRLEDKVLTIRGGDRKLTVDWQKDLPVFTEATVE